MRTGRLLSGPRNVYDARQGTSRFSQEIPLCLCVSVVKMVFESCPKTSNLTSDFGYHRGIWNWIGEFVRGLGCREIRASMASFSSA